jgi:hypothetical protein
MTPMRKLALKISHLVVRYASPGSKEWAEGLAREVAFIENDWSALAWAFGSTRLLLDYREAPIGSLADVPSAAQKFVESMRRGAVEWIFILLSPFYVLKFFHSTWWPERAGCVLVILSSISAGIFLFMERRRLKDPPSDNIYHDLIACAQFYRAELERRRSTVWIPTSAVFGWIVGTMLSDRGNLYFHAVFSAGIVLLALAASPVFAVAQRINRRRIGRLDALLAERS